MNINDTVCTDIVHRYKRRRKEDLYQHRENVPQVAVLVHCCQVVQNALCKKLDDNDGDEEEEDGDDDDV